MNGRDDNGRTLASDGGPPADAKGGVGHGRPPEHRQFKPGQSGNLKGRPRGARGRAKIIEEIACETHVGLENGKRQRRSTLELVLLSLRNRSFDGNVQAFRAVHQFLQRYGLQEPQRAGGFLVVGERLTVEEWERRAAKLNEFQERLKTEWEAKHGAG